jgi:hypothetical protein
MGRSVFGAKEIGMGLWIDVWPRTAGVPVQIYVSACQPGGREGGRGE